jgi:hypothetical protein
MRDHRDRGRETGELDDLRQRRVLAATSNLPCFAQPGCLFGMGCGHLCSLAAE